LSSGETNIEKINRISAASVLIKVMRNTIGARRKISGRIDKEVSEARKGNMMTKNNKEATRTNITCPFLLDISLNQKKPHRN